jgi:SPP1 gp7 family putative phage head morphogenesis protein
MSTFTDEILDRRERSMAMEEAAAASVRMELVRTRNRAIAKLQRLPYIPEGERRFRENRRTREGILNTINEMEDLIDEGFLGAKRKLLGAKRSAFRRGSLDVKYAVDSGVAGKQVKLGVSFGQVFKAAAEDSATKPLTMGKSVLRDFGKLSTKTKDAMRATLTNAVTNGESIPQTSAKLQKAFGLTEVQAERVARTHLNAAVNNAHMLEYNSNPDVFSGYKWDTTFDSRTSDICARLHGTFYPLGSKPPGPPAHPNCRSILVGVFRDPDLDEAERTSLRRTRTGISDPKRGIRGPEQFVRSDAKFEAWLRRQSAEVQRRILGTKTKQQLWAGRKIDIRDIVGENLEYRRNKEVVRRALAKNRDDEQIRRLARRFGVDFERATIQQINKEQLKVLKEVKHTIGIPQGASPQLAKFITDLNIAKGTIAQALNLTKARRLARLNRKTGKPSAGKRKKTPTPEELERLKKEREAKREAERLKKEELKRKREAEREAKRKEREAKKREAEERKRKKAEERARKKAEREAKKAEREAKKAQREALKAQNAALKARLKEERARKLAKFKKGRVFAERAKKEFALFERAFERSLDLTDKRKRLTKATAEFNRSTEEIRQALLDMERGRLSIKKQKALLEIIDITNGKPEEFNKTAGFLRKRIRALDAVEDRRRQRFNDAVMRSLLKDEGQRAPYYMHVQSGTKQAEMKESIEKWMQPIRERLPNTLNAEGVTVIDLAGGRSQYDPLLNNMEMSEDAFIPSYWHEFGHHIETINPHVMGAAEAFLDRRTAGQPLLHFVDEYPDSKYRSNEVFRRSPKPFVTDYVGKEYRKYRGLGMTPGKRVATEVTSVGFERFFLDAFRFATGDDEHFELIYDILDGRVKPGG